MPPATVLRRPSVHNVPSASGTTDRQSKTFLPDAEMTRLLRAAKHSRHGVRDYALLLVGYRHGLRVSELVGLRLDHVRLEEGRIWVTQ
jgi:type 1 fimbriae regulatory protein FimB